VTVEQTKGVTQGNTMASSSTSSSVANAASNVMAGVSNTVNKAVAGLTSQNNTTNMSTVTRTSDTVISAANAPVPTKEYTEFVQLPKVVENTQVQTQYQSQQVQEETIKLKQQPIQVIEQPTVIKTQPVITHKQVVEVEQERPIEMIKKTVGHETLPAIEKKEVIVQPVRAVDQNVNVITKQVVENGQTVTYEVRAGSADARVIQALNTSGVNSEQGVIERVKEAVGGTKTHADNLIQLARDKATDVLHHDVKSSNYVAGTTSTTSSNVVGTQGQTTVKVQAPAGATVKRT